jgi:transposase
MHKALTPMHLTRQHVVSDVTGETGLARMRAMLAGERDPVPVARLRNDRGPHDEETIAQARHGPWREEPLGAFAQAVALDDMDHEQSGACDRQSAAALETCAACQDRDALPPVSRPRQRARHRPQVDGRSARQRSTGVDLTAIAGLDAPTAVTSSRASGLDLGRWPTVQQCTAWLGLCPHHRVSGGQV